MILINKKFLNDLPNFPFPHVLLDLASLCPYPATAQTSHLLQIPSLQDDPMPRQELIYLLCSMLFDSINRFPANCVCFLFSQTANPELSLS